MANPNGTFQFPAFAPDFHPRMSADTYRRDDIVLSLEGNNGSSSNNNYQSQQQWQTRRYSNRSYRPNIPSANGPLSKLHPLATRHTRQKSLSEAIHNIRNRSGSVSQNAMEIAEALKAPVSPTLVALFFLWYFASVMSSTSSKQILLALPRPVTLTIMQFTFVFGWCLLISSLSSTFPVLRRRIPALKGGIKRPTRELLVTTLPITGFMIAGHILSSDAISRIDVSLVHTIKGLSPIITVCAYRFILNVRYSLYTYLSLIPLTVGVFMACSINWRANFLGIVSAFASAILFVTQNIVSKKIFVAADLAEKDPFLTRKPDKLNLLCYSSLLGLALTFPLWLWSEGFTIIGQMLRDGTIQLSKQPGAHGHSALAWEYLTNGSFHFLQSLTAFVLLSMVSPVTYSVASLVKRVFVIIFSILWFGNHPTRIQGFGICLTLLGLYLYDRTSDAAKADRRARALQPGNITLLPLEEKPCESPATDLNGFIPHTSLGKSSGEKINAYRSDHATHTTSNGWLPPGVNMENTWKHHDIPVGAS